MIRRTIMQLGAVLLMALGVFLAGWGPLILPILGIPPLPAPDPQAAEAIGIWKLAAFVRLFGAAVLGLGLMIWAMRGVGDAVTVRRVARSAALANGLILILVLTQQLAIWSSVSGVALVGFFAVTTALFGLASLGPRAVAQPQEEKIPESIRQDETLAPEPVRPGPVDELME